MNGPYKTIGILGGAGAAASAALITRITDRVTATGAKFDQEHPEMVLINATQAPSRSIWLENRGPSFVPAYIKAATRLKAAGADFAVMCCNTAHVARAEIEAAADLPIHDLIEHALMQANPDGLAGRKIGLLCSDGVRKAGIYQKCAEELWGTHSVLEVSQAMQARVTQGIIGVKRGLRRDGGEASPLLHFAAAADELRSNGADVIILGCTEIPLAFGGTDWPHLPLIDTIEVLSDICLQYAGFTQKGRAG